VTVAVRKQVFTNQRRDDYGKGEVRIDPEAERLTPQGMVEYLRKTLASPAYRAPVLPSVAMELMRLTRQSQVRLPEVRQVLERDPLLAARVLQLAQSALYSGGVAIRSLDEAITRLGLRTLEELFLQTVLSMRVFRANGYEEPMANLMQHSLVTAHVARQACRLTSLPDEYAFLCGLLHDAGMAAGLLIFADAPAPASGTRPSGGKAAPPPFEEVSFALQVVHEEASAILADTWGLHPEIRTVLGIHHHFKQGNRVHPLAAAVCVADWIASEAGTAMGTECDPRAADEAARQLGFSQRTLVELGGRAREILAQS
jgi:HD-like signal output (HDOD) protein